MGTVIGVGGNECSLTPFSFIQRTITKGPNTRRKQITRWGTRRPPGGTRRGEVGVHAGAA